MSSPAGIDPRTVQLVASRYTDWAIPAAKMKLKEYQNMIYIKLGNVNLPAEVTNRECHIGKGLADDLIKKYERW